MDRGQVEAWLAQLLEEGFGVKDSQKDDAAIARLEARDWLYIYAEIYKRYQVKISKEDILDNCFLSFEKLVSCLCG